MTPIGSLPSAQTLDLAIGLPLRNREALTNLLEQLYDPASPLYHQYLTPGQFTEQFGPTKEDYEAVVAFAQANGFTVTGRHPNRVLVDVTGSVADVERVLHLKMQVYQHPKEDRTFYAPSAEPSIDLGTAILDISGLNNYHLPTPRVHVQPRTQNSANAVPNAGSGPSGTYVGNDFRNAYAPGVSLTGTGQTLGLLQFDGYYAADITAYENLIGLSGGPTIQTVLLDGYSGKPTRGANSGNVEVSLDIEMAISMAPGLSKIIMYEAGPYGTPNDIISQMANDNLAKTLSCSWGWSGGPSGTTDQLFQQMASQGQSFFCASGDSDAYPAGAIDNSSNQDTPSDDPYITIVGGTTLTTGSGASYSSETVWNWGGGTGSSGGTSSYYAIPTWQQGVSMANNQGSTSYRNIPDVALTADNVYVLYGNGSSETVGGTSCASPLWAAMVALVNQQAAANSLPAVGFINPAIYQIGKSGNYGTVFHDVTAGNNESTSSPSQFTAVAGFDLCTGWGTPRAAGLISALTGPAAPLVISNSLAIVTESCPSGAVDPGETVTLNFGLKNAGGVNTTNLVATLLATGGVTAPSGAQAYGVLTGGGATVTRPFTFTASGTCGGTVTATLQLQDGSANMGTVNFVLPLGTLIATTNFIEGFDSVTAPALPAGWTTNATGVEVPWVTATGTADTAPNAAFAVDTANVGLTELISPPFVLTANPAQLKFRNNYYLEADTSSGSIGYDGGVLEIKIGNGAFTDIVTAGGSFASNGYNRTISTQWGNPLAGRQAWSGNSGGYITTIVNLPAAALGQTIQLKWRCGTDNGVAWTGWYIDSISVTGGARTCCTPGTDLAITQSASPNPPVDGQNLVYLLTITNSGPVPATSVTVTDSLPVNVSFVSASAGGANAAGKVIWTVSSLAAGAATNFVLTVTPTIAGPITNIAYAASATTDSNPANNATTNILTANAPPAISTQPSNQTAIAGNIVQFSVSAGGTSPLQYQWLFDNAPLAGATASSLVLSNVAGNQAGTYAVIITNVAGAATSSPATLTVLMPSVIMAQPLNRTVVVGSDTSFQIMASGTGPLAYQWTFNGGTISSATASTLSLTNVQPAQAGSYAVIVTNIAGSATSAVANLRVLVPPSVFNLSATGKSVGLSFQSVSGLTYTLEYKTLLTDTNWTPIPPSITGDGTVLTLQDSDSTEVSRFYRVLCQ